MSKLSEKDFLPHELKNSKLEWRAIFFEQAGVPREGDSWTHFMQNGLILEVTCLGSNGYSLSLMHPKDAKPQIDDWFFDSLFDVSKEAELFVAGCENVAVIHGNI